MLEVDLHNLRVLWRKEVTELIRVLSVVEPTLVSVVMANQVV